MDDEITIRKIPHNYVIVGDFLPSLKKFGWSEARIDRQEKFNKYEFARGEKFHCLAQLTSYKKNEDNQIRSFALGKYPTLKHIGECLEVSASEAIAILNEYAEYREKTLGIGGKLSVNPDRDPYFDPITNEPIQPGVINPRLVPDNWKKADRFTFPEHGIPMGAVLDYTIDSKIKCIVVGEREVKYNGIVFPSLTSITCHLLKRKAGSVSGTSYWKYNGVYVKNVY